MVGTQLPIGDIDEASPNILTDAIEVLVGKRIAIVTGAGVSTDSGIPDYRGKGAPVRTPMTAQDFLSSDAARRRYWIGSHLGWKAFAAAQPNDGHRALAELEADGAATGIVTQNVDGLHLRGEASGSWNCTEPCAASCARTVVRCSTAAIWPRAWRRPIPG